MNSRNRSLLISSAVAGLVCGVALTQQQVKAATEDPATSSEKVVEVQAPGSKTEADTSVNDSNGLTDADANSGSEINTTTNESTEVDKNVTNRQSTEAKQQVSIKAGQGSEVIDQGTWGTSKWEYTREGDDYVLHLHEGTLGLPKWYSDKFAYAGVGQLNENFKNQLTKIKFDSGVIANQNSAGLFYGLTNLKSIEGLENLDTSNVTNMRQMFEDSSNLTELDLSKFNTSKVTNMYNMFMGCTNLKSLDLSSFDTSKVTDMWRMFFGCEKLISIDVSHFNTSNVTTMSEMFLGCKKLEEVDVSNFDTSNVTDMSWMFEQCYSLKTIDVSNFDTSNVTDMSWMFDGCYSLKNIDVSNFDTSKVTKMNSMFMGCSNLKSINVSNFDTSNVTDMSFMFDSCSSLKNINVSNFNTSNVTDIHSMFYSCHSLENIDLSHFDTSKVEEMTFMFNSCWSLTDLDLSNFDTFNVTDMKHMFRGDDKLDHLVLGINTKFSADTALPVNQANGKKIMWKATEGYQKGKRYSSDELMAMPGRDQVTTYDWSNEKNIIKTTTESKTVTRLINIHQPVGGVKSVEQTAVISRAVNTYDDGTTDYGEWSKSQWNACEIPTFAGYEANIKEIPAQVVTDQTTNQTIDVTYGPAKQIVTIQYIDKGNVIGTQQIRGEIGEKIKPNYEVPAGYILVCPPTIITVDKSGNQVVKINVKHEIVKGTESRTVTRTINVHQPDGSVTTTKQVVTLSRSYTEDKATGQKTYASWRTGNWARVTVPKLKGYTASSAFVPAEKVTSDSQDQLVDIYYTADK
ncbi:BspA family leucine-rich repeat surface protein [Lactobacillus sp. M0390]|uniref:BspA family leucine-rich repeat surface protein n=1 Tax=Lactobacillus sp. M0390 TaxID=2751026 RepID=UPI0018DCB25C|nr:BspA family leucine-rich repeat surface protein [Lactobacillus sp. M0390]MBH9986373.1 BspA family leucine-rich repeat surface protein [Lactobacillus sp. M0390]